MAPAGKHVLSCFCQYFPYQVAGRSWDDGLREQMADRILDKLAEYAPNIKDAVIARQMLSPLDLERRFGLTGGNIFHGEITPDQSFNLRPLSGYADYRTPAGRPVPVRLGRAPRRRRHRHPRPQRGAGGDRRPGEVMARLGDRWSIRFAVRSSWCSVRKTIDDERGQSSIVHRHKLKWV